MKVESFPSVQVTIHTHDGGLLQEYNHTNWIYSRRDTQAKYIEATLGSIFEVWVTATG